mmetsp:Transcript_16673/g.30332  ORF Transcript_16673/g.30332 Transcript_16673/m.30332 type:complete len:392 (-) Transcript_16673:22-1197(-)
MVSRPAVCMTYSIPICVFLLVMRKGCHAFPMSCHGMRQSSSRLRTQNTRMRAAEEEDGTITTDTSIMAMAKYTLERVAATILPLVPPTVFSISPPMLEPNPPQSMEEQSHRQAVSDALSKGYTNLRSRQEEESSGSKGAFVELSESERLLFNDTPSNVDDDDSEEEFTNPSTYGEITELGARQLFWYMKLLRNDDNMEGTTTTTKASSSSSSASNVQFYDLGSGAGKLVLQTYMELPCLTRAVGIELAPSRHDLAIQAYNTLQQDTTASGSSSSNSQTQSILDHARAKIPNYEPRDAVVEFQQGDIFESKVIHKATHIYVSSLCFPSDTMQRLAESIIRSEARSCLKCLATLQPCELLQDTFGPPRMECVEMTWTKPTGQGCPVYFYDNTP